MRLHPEKRACPRRGNTPTVEAVLDRHQSERGGKGCWDTEQLDRDWASSFRARIASEPPCPREARVRALRTGEDHVRRAWRSYGGRRQAHINALVSHELDAGAPVRSAAGVAPEQRRGTHSQRMRASHSPGAALPWRSPPIDTVRAVGKSGSGECWRHRPRADCHRSLGAAPGPEATALRDSAASHPAGKESRLR
jgi:hypothetical protein